MKNLTKLLMFVALFLTVAQSCNEKSNLTKSEFEYENVLKDNKILLNEVNVIVNQYESEIESKLNELTDCNSFAEFKVKYNTLTNDQKAKIWKNRLIDGIKNKKISENEIKFITGLYNLIKPEIFTLDSKENIYFNEYSIKKLIKDTETEKFSFNLLLTTNSLTDDLVKIQKVCKSKKDNNTKSSCSCRWGTFCGPTFSCGGNCTHVKDFCGFMGLQDCTGTCIQYEQ